MSANQRGFTLVELIVVIVILGILAATALPRFINVTGQAQTASVQGFAGGVTSSVGMVQAAYFAAGNMAAVSATMADTTVINVQPGSGVPTGTALGIGAAIRCQSATECNGYVPDYTTATAVTFTPNFSANCGVTYNGTTGAVTTDTTC